MDKLRRTVLLFLYLIGALGAAELPVKIQRVLDTATGMRHGFLGLLIVNAATGEVLFESNQTHSFVPASNSKLFTTALGLARLGPDYQFHTTLVAARAPDREARIAGPVP